MNRAFDVIIVGGGIVGAACAAAMARAGLHVALVERDCVGGGATAAGMGHIVVMDDSMAQLSLTRYSQILWKTIAATLPTNAEYDACGTIWIARDDDEMAEAERKQAVYRDSDVPSHLLTAHQLAELEPHLRPGLAGGLLVPEDAVVYSPCVALHLVRDAQAYGAELILGRTVTSMSGGEVLLDDDSHLSAPRLVNAAGAWSPEMTKGIPIKKRKGHLVITERYPGFLRHQVVELGYLKSAHSINTDSVAFNVQPRRTGQILIGSSRQYGNEDQAVEQGMLTTMMERAVEFMPGIAGLSAIRAWTGFRAATPDKLPLIGPSLTDASVWLASGHEGLGITTSLGTAALLADSFIGRAPAIAATAYLPARYAQPNPDETKIVKEKV
jgi:glycine/D-amino acid oxidase-like deaminating enzyme